MIHPPFWGTNWFSNLLRHHRARRLLTKLGQVCDWIAASPDQVRRTIAPVRDPDGFSVAIAHYNRGSRIHLPLRNLLAHPGVSEVVILDDGSEPEEFAALEAFVAGLAAKGKVRLHRRKENRGALVTKYEAVELCSSDWVLVLDSDNTAFRHYLDRLHGLRDKRSDTIYSACWAFPFFPFHELGGKQIDFEGAAAAVRSGLLRRAFVLNDGNYLVPRDRYVATARALGTLRADVADVMLLNYLWLTGGGRLELLPATAYFHRVDPSSFWMRTQDASRERVLEIFERLERALPCDADYVARLQAGSAISLICG